jgi:ankyrin repeat protein
MDKMISLAKAAALGDLRQVESHLLGDDNPNLFDSEKNDRYNTTRKHGIHYETPLVAASDNGFLLVAQILVDHNADINLASRINHGGSYWLTTPLEAAITGNYPELVKMLVAHGAVWTYDAHRSDPPPLYYAIDKNHGSLALWLLEKGFYSENDLTRWSMASPLSLSIIRKQPEVAKKLIQIGVDVNQADYSGDTALCHAALCSLPESVELITLLLKAGADINASDDDWHSPLHNAVQWNMPQNVEALLRGGANVNAMDKSGYSPLHTALFTNVDRTEIVKILLRYNADTYLVNEGLKTDSRPYSGKDALQMAEIAGSKYGAKPYQKAYAGIIRHHREQRQVD